MKEQTKPHYIVLNFYAECKVYGKDGENPGAETIKKSVSKNANLPKEM